MARPARSLWVSRWSSRRRHRTWILSITLASLGWGCWWIALFIAKFTSIQPDLAWVEVAAGIFGVPGLLAALWTVRAQKAWLLLTCIPIFANLGLLALPWVLPEHLFAS